jgi:glycosyltransferase involved in cell wall biosynthesis
MAEVAVILPAKDCSRYIAQALDSLLKQKYRDFECIIVYAKSSDETRAIIDAYISRDSRFKVYEGRGLGLADDLNLGIEKAKSQYIFRFDADDIARPNRISTQIKYLKEGVHIVGGNVHYFGSTFPRNSNFPIGSCALKFYALFRNPLAHPSVAFRRDLDLRYDSKYDGIEDYELWTRCLMAGSINIVNLKEVLIDYRVHKNQSTKLGEKERVSRLRQELSSRMCSILEVPQELRHIFNKISALDSITYQEAELIVGYINGVGEINSSDRNRILREVYLSTQKLAHLEAISLVSKSIHEQQKWWRGLINYCILRYGSGPLDNISKLTRVFGVDNS